MIATPLFVFVHLHKSGGTFVNELLTRFIPEARLIGYHWPRSRVPVELAALPVLGFVRNPWSFYVSWYAYQRASIQPNVLFNVLSDKGRLGFEDTIRQMLSLGSDDECLDRLLTALPDEYTGSGLNLPRSAAAPLRGSGLGFYAYLHRHMFAGREDTLHVGRVERLREDVVTLFNLVGQDVSDGMRAFLDREPPRNPSHHGPYATFYSPSLRDLVAERDAPVVAKYDYRFDAGTSA